MMMRGCVRQHVDCSTNLPPISHLHITVLLHKHCTTLHCTECCTVCTVLHCSADMHCSSLCTANFDFLSLYCGVSLDGVLFYVYLHESLCLYLHWLYLCIYIKCVCEMNYVWRLYHRAAPTVLAAISNVTDFLDGIVMPPSPPSPSHSSPPPPSQHWEPLQGVFGLSPLADRSGSQELDTLKTVANVGAWQLEEPFRVTRHGHVSSSKMQCSAFLEGN